MQIWQRTNEKNPITGKVRTMLTRKCDYVTYLKPITDPNVWLVAAVYNDYNKVIYKTDNVQKFMQNFRNKYFMTGPSKITNTLSLFKKFLKDVQAANALYRSSIGVQNITKIYRPKMQINKTIFFSRVRVRWPRTSFIIWLWIICLCCGDDWWAVTN